MPLKIEALADYVAEAALGYCRAQLAALSVSDGSGKKALSIRHLDGAPPNEARRGEIERLAAGRERLLDGCRAVLPLVGADSFSGTLVLESATPLEADQIRVAEHLVEFASLSLENSLLRSRMLVDQLTGLFKSDYVKATLDREIKMARGLEKKVAVLLLDIDNFGEINRTYGSSTGDAVLAATGERLAQELASILGLTARRVNVWLEGHVGRAGGDEFAFLIFDASQKVAADVAQRILEAFSEKPIKLQDGEISLTLSIGGALFPDDAATAEKLFLKAYHALYTAKMGGKNQFCLFSRTPPEPQAGLSQHQSVALSVALKAVSEDLPLETLLGRLLSHLMRETRADRGRIVVVDDRGRPAATARAAWKGEDPPFLYSRANRDTAIRVPLEARGRNVGVIELESTSPRFTPEDQGFLKALGPRAGAALDHARRLQAATADLKRLEETLRQGLRELGSRYAFHNLIGRSKPMTEVFGLLEKVCRVDYPAIVEGETGTGKELVAKSIHFTSRRKDRPFIPVNCSAIAETILESELFGHVKGAFTGADEYKQGLFELANGGTLFLDEIEVMGHPLQHKLLRVLEDRRVRPVGAKEEISVDVRVIASTNRSVRELVREGKLREDLYYRLATFVIHLPPLRERAEDIPLIAEHLLAQIARETGGTAKTLDPASVGLLMAYSWPGNVRELRNELRKAYVLSSGERILPDNFSPHVNPSQLTPAYEGDYAEAMKAFEGAMIRQALERNKWNLTRTAEVMKLARNTLKSKMKEHGIEDDQKSTA